MTGDAPGSSVDAAVDELFETDGRIPLVYWAAFSGARTTVILVGALATLAFVTGLSHLSQGTGRLTGPLGGVVPPATADVVPILGVLLAFLLAIVTVGLQRRLRLAATGALLVLLAGAVVPLLTAGAIDVVLLAGVVLAVPLVVRNRDAFDRPLDLTPFQVAALAAFLAVQVYGTLGAYALREQYTGIETWTDAFYYIVVTGTTVGYGDATPVTPGAKLFTLSFLVIGTAAFGVAFGSLLAPAIESRISTAFGTMTASELTLLEDHVLVLGAGDLTVPLLDELDPAADVVVITPDGDVASALTDRGVRVVTDDPTDTDVLRSARVDTARGVVVATADDARDTLAVLAVRQVNPDVRVVAAATDQRHVDKLSEVGADEVISPAVIGGRLLGRAVLGEEADTDGPAADAPD